MAFIVSAQSFNFQKGKRLNEDSNEKVIFFNKNTKIRILQIQIFGVKCKNLSREYKRIIFDLKIHAYFFSEWLFAKSRIND